ncbi:hypothetical protein BZA70DRAFT_281412 [Myxozyma melibiosi]|uniref:Uncharacterized protein n=1 Tax=Myxozyma melibiosi TaxID=54550 RepID=A0ABR1F2L9_9ASCO
MSSTNNPSPLDQATSSQYSTSRIRTSLSRLPLELPGLRLLLSQMCRSATCSTCSGKTWTGCGMHISSVLDSVPKDQWCTCAKPAGSEYPPQGEGGCVIS